MPINAPPYPNRTLTVTMFRQHGKQDTGVLFAKSEYPNPTDIFCENLIVSRLLLTCTLLAMSYKTSAKRGPVKHRGQRPWRRWNQ